MRAADLLLSKSGPQTVVEAIASELPLISTGYIPGQEEPIPEWVEKTGIGKYMANPKETVKIINELIEKKEIEKMKKNMRRIKNPKVTYETAGVILSLAFH